MGVGAPAITGTVAGNERQRHEAATTGSLELAEPGREEEFALVGTRNKTVGRGYPDSRNAGAQAETR